VQLVSETRPQVRQDRLLRRAEVSRLTGLGRTSIYTLERKGEFPARVRITERSVAWAESAVLQWVQDRIAPAKPAGDEGHTS